MKSHKPFAARYLLLLAFCWWESSWSQRLLARPVRYALEGHEKPVALLTAGKATYLVTEQSVFRREGRRFVRHYRSPAPIRCALATDTALWLGTQQGLQQLSSKSWRSQPLSLPEPAGQAAVTTLFADGAGHLWAGALGYGAYQLREGHWQEQLRIPTVNAGLTTLDSVVWIATNIGLHRWQRGVWTRYNEEGVANAEIPDNLVENLLLDNRGNLWVLMSQGVSVFERQGTGAAHLPTVKYIGRPGNEVASVAYLPGQGYVFATAMGVLLLPDQPGGELAGFEATTDKVATPQVLVPLTVPGTPAIPNLLAVDKKQRIWVLSTDEISVWRAKAFRQATSSTVTQPKGKNL